MMTVSILNILGAALYIICGSMFSGKSDELFRQLRKAKYNGGKVICFAPSVSRRKGLGDDDTHAYSRSGSSIDITWIDSLKDIDAEDLVKQGYKHVGIDEGQLFPDLLHHVLRLLNAGLKVYVSTLDQDSNKQPFGPSGQLLMLGGWGQKQHACCSVCGRKAVHSKFIGDDKGGQVKIGNSDYEPRCRHCHEGEPRGSLGELHVIVGPVGSGKKKDVLAKIEPYRKAGKSILAFEYREDDQRPNWGPDWDTPIVSLSSEDLPSLSSEQSVVPEIVVIRHGHLAPVELHQRVCEFMERGCKVIVSGLNMTASTKPEFYPSMVRLAVEADNVYSLFAVCQECSQPAFRSKQVGPGLYEAHCWHCMHDPANDL